MATDPVCGMYVDERSAELVTVRDNRSYYFCSRGCLDTFVEPHRRLRTLHRKLLIAWPASALVLILTYAVSGSWVGYAAFALATVVQFYAGSDFYRGFLDAIRNRSPNMDVLIASGTTAAYAYSTAALFLPTGLPPVYYFDASTLIVK
jgi:cation transport ATPase